MATSADFIVIGAGIAGASAGYFLAPHGRVVLLERELHPGYHTTGRSAALFTESYGTAQVRALTCASREFFEHPPAGFSEHPLLAPRGAMLVGTRDQARLLEEAYETVRSVSAHAQRLDAESAVAWVPVLERSVLAGAVVEPDAADMDVHAIHQGYLRGLTRLGGRIECDAEVTACERNGAGWEVEAGGRTYRGSVVINAAGAWCDAIARLAGAKPVAIEPRRRSAFLFAPPEGLACAHWPMVLGVDESYYFKPDAGMLLGSPANADLVEPQDVQAEEHDVALGIQRIEQATSLRIRRPTRVWAGLRSFVTDGDLVGGYDPECAGFFWLVAQGGYGIQTSPAMGQACAALVRGAPIPERITGFGLTAEMLSRSRTSLVRQIPAQ